MASTSTAWEAWIADRVGPIRTGKRVLVLCRTRVTQSLVRRWVARTGGALGFEAATPATLAQQVRQDPLLGAGRHRSRTQDTVPPTTAIGRRIGARPGLTGYARRWVQHLRLASRAGVALGPPDWLAELAATGWGRDDDEDALGYLLDAVGARGRKLSASAAWDRVVAIGFDRPPSSLHPWEPFLVRKLTGRPIAAAPAPGSGPPSGPIEAVRVPDVVAEARVAVTLAAADPDGTAILVTDTATARRVRDALARSGVPCAWRDSDALGVHALASAVRRAASWFAEPPDPPVQIADLAFVLGCTALHRELHPAAEQARRALIATRPPRKGGTDIDVDADAQLSRRSIAAALEEARLLDAPLSAWTRRLVERVGQARKGWIAAASAAIAVRLTLLSAALAARSVEDALSELVGAPLTFDPDDFDDVIAELLGDGVAEHALPGGHTLGAVKRFLVSLRVRVHDDPVARAVLAALRDRSEWPVTPSHVHHALARSNDLDVLSDGVDVISVDDWDGRPCRQLIVLDAHDHGLTRRTSPDPLLTEAELADLGAVSGRAAVAERLAQVQRAAARAERVIAVVTERDAGGREVVPPIQLDLRWRAGWALAGADEPVPSYGWRLAGLPENASLVLEAAPGACDPAPGAVPAVDAVVELLADQACAEWHRDGRGQGAPPPRVARLLGDAVGAPEATLPRGERDEHSVSRLFRPLVHCPYQAFARRIVRVDERRELAQELEPREVGRAVHAALEAAEVSWRVADREDRADAIVGRLRAATDDAFNEQLASLGDLSAARRASANGRRSRWNAHWPQYVDSRLLPPPSPPSFERLYPRHPAVEAAVAAFRRTVPAGRDLPDWRVKAWVVWAAGAGPGRLAEFAPAILLRRGESTELPESCLPDLPNLARDRDLDALHQVVSGVERKLAAWRRPLAGSLAEVGFGTPPDDPEVRGTDAPVRLELGETRLRLGREEIKVTGRIDRIDLLDPEGGERWAAIVDYKTGSAVLPWQFRRDQLELRDPQLLVYAMVAQVTGRDKALPDALRHVRVALVAEDRVEHVVREPEVGQKPIAPETWIPIDGVILGWAASELGRRLDDARDGRWPLSPRADTCPMLSSFGNDRCPAAAACRLRALPVVDDAHAVADGASDGDPA